MTSTPDSSIYTNVLSRLYGAPGSRKKGKKKKGKKKDSASKGRMRPPYRKRPAYRKRPTWDPYLCWECQVPYKELAKIEAMAVDNRGEKLYRGSRTSNTLRWGQQTHLSLAKHPVISKAGVMYRDRKQQRSKIGREHKCVDQFNRSAWRQSKRSVGYTMMMEYFDHPEIYAPVTRPDCVSQARAAARAAEVGSKEDETFSLDIKSKKEFPPITV